MTNDGRTVATISGQPVVDSPRAKVLQELERHGYVAEPHSASAPGGAVYRHPAAPRLLVDDDGRIELLSGQPDTRRAVLPHARTNPVRWGRAMVFFTLLG